MTLATVEPDGRPSARLVLCRGIDTQAGWLVFYTDRESAKGRALEVNPRAALVFHWDAFERQARIEGLVTRAPDADSDAYWNSRPRDARPRPGAVDAYAGARRRRVHRRRLELDSTPALRSFRKLRKLSPERSEL